MRGALLLFLLEELAVAGRVLERGEADGARHAATLRALAACGGKDRRGPEQPAERERPEPRAPVLAVHAGIVGSAACESARSETSCST